MKNIGLYIHIPFCKSKCIYCAFLSFANKKNCIEPYFKELKNELLHYKPKIKSKQITSIFIGGGTPSFVDGMYIKDILTFVKQNFHVSKDAEISCEANPESFDQTIAKQWKEAGINRLSFGLQSDDDLVLKSLNRPHSYGDFEKAIKIAKCNGFLNINADLLLGIDGQTSAKLKNTLTNLKSLGLTHISCYGLMVEDDTPLKTMLKNNTFKILDEDKSVELYNNVQKILKRLDYNRYEISNFALSGYECKHNQNYWNSGEFLGVGLGAYSFLFGEHWNNTSNLNDYITKKYRRFNIEKQTPKTQMEEMIMLSLRTESGLDLVKFNQTFGVDFQKKFEKVLKELQKDNLIEIKDEHLRVTNFEISNFVIEKFF